ncbi:MAG: ABC transporter substrate-binding protein [Methanocellales archaeon]|nr:ABC transporter substrate-binding protein [Methanocellales archaeon]MDD5235694.1 ABC transporter substrate-binding protein [Methanocellales archaeon]MDD5485620.1 ABC transporter substrate-binding protein [Methanocellales archaeon]
MKMSTTKNKQVGAWIAIIVLIGAAFGSGYALANMSTEGGATATIGSITVIDGEGRTVTLTTTPNRIIVLTPGYAETLYAIGCGDNIIAVDNSTAQKGWPLEVRNKTTVGTASAPSLEKIIDLDPDLIIAYPYSRNALSSLESNVPIYYVAYETSYEDVLGGILVAGLLTNRSSEAKSVVSTMQSKIDAITSLTKDINKTARPLVYYETSSVPGRCAGPNTLGNDLIYKAGGINIAADEPVAYPTLSNEYIIERSPDIILITWYGQSIDDVKARSGWNSIDAVKNSRVYKLSDISGVGPNAWMALEEVAKWLHPELFES